MTGTRILAAIALAFAMSGCGFHPLYGDSGATAETAGKLASIYVAPIETPQRLGYEMRNTLIDMFNSSGRMSENFYRLHVTLSQKSQGVAVQNDAAITRYNDTLLVKYELTDAKGALITQGTETGLSAYNVVASPYATLTAQQDSDTRSAEDIAYRIRTDLAVFFEREARAEIVAEMIVKSSDADRCATHPPRNIAAFLVFGPDTGLVRERAETLMKTVVDDLSDAFRVADLDDSTLVSDPARLSDEAAAISMLGGRRVVRVRGAGNNLAKLFETFLEEPAGDALVVVEGGDLAKGTGLRKLFEGADNAAAIACYPDSARDLFDVVRSGLKAQGLAIAPDALEDAVSRLGSDRGVTRRELEKLALYAHGQKSVSLEDVRATLGDEAEARVEEAIDAAGSGDVAKLDLALERLWIAGTSPIQVVRQALSHFQRLLLVNIESQHGESIDGAMRKLRPPVHFARATAFKNQAQRWSESALSDALDQLLDTEALCKTTAVPAEAACGRALMNVAARAKTR